VDINLNLNWIIGMILGASAVIILGLGIVLGRRKSGTNPSGSERNLSIDLLQLPHQPVSTSPVRMELYGTPVQLRVLVLAPIGRGSRLPATAQLAGLLNHFLPDFMEVVDQHHPIFRKWPEQFSASGFSHSFFNNLALPGMKGKGTVWCSAAGKFEALGSQFFIGLVFSTASPNSLSQISVQHAGQWLDILRIQKSVP